MRFVYVNGPSWLGSWEGQATSDICSGLTHVDARHWAAASGSEACTDLLDRKVRASVIGVTVVGSVALAWSAIQTLVNFGFLACLRRAEKRI